MKLLASDFDNTLAFVDIGIKDTDIKAIKSFQEKGHIFGICSGRPLHSILHESKKYGFRNDFIIVNSGSVIADGNGKILFERKIPYNLVKEIHKTVQVNLSIVLNDHFYFIYPLPDLLFPGIYLDSLDEIDPEEVSGFSFHYQEGEEEMAEETCQMINRVYKNQLSAFRNGIHVDVAGRDCSKGKAFLKVGEMFKADHEDLAGIGDSFNDLTLLEVCHHRFTFPYAPNVLKETSTDIVDSVADAVQHLCLIDK